MLFVCDYGKSIQFGKDVWVNVNFYFMDEAKITIGNHVWIGTNVSIMLEVTIGAGSVVIKDIEKNCLAVGIPCQVTKRIDNDDCR